MPMTKDQVVYVRDTLKMGMNLPVKVSIDNMSANFDEGAVGEFIKWDDDNEVVTCFRLDSPQTNYYPNNAGKSINVYSAAYNDIQVIEVSRFPLQYVQQLALDLGVSEPYATNVAKMFDQLLRGDLANITSQDYERIMGGRVGLPNRDEYYSGQFTESFQETRSTAFNNKYVDEKRAASKDDSDDGDTNP